MRDKKARIGQGAAGRLTLVKKKRKSFAVLPPFTMKRPARHAI
jgi:hypothetical protein